MISEIISVLYVVGGLCGLFITGLCIIHLLKGNNIRKEVQAYAIFMTIIFNVILVLWGLGVE